MMLQLIGESLEAPRAQAERLFAELGVSELQEASQDPDRVKRVDPFTVAVGLGSVILMLPPAVDAVINLVDRARRNTARQEVDALKSVLADAKAECIITTSGGRILVLPKAATDDIVDAIIADLVKTPPR